MDMLVHTHPTLPLRAATAPQGKGPGAGPAVVPAPRALLGLFALEKSLPGPGQLPLYR